MGLNVIKDLASQSHLNKCRDHAAAFNLFDVVTSHKVNILPVTLAAADEVEQVLSRKAAGWHGRAPGVPVPARDWLLVFVGDTQEDMRAAAAGAAAAGFERGAVLEGGLHAYGHAALQQVAKPLLPATACFAISCPQMVCKTGVVILPSLWLSS
jgi:hypothetical protein